MEDNDYWETRYRKGGTSGTGSLSDLKKWKWNLIDSFFEEIDDVVDVGCGDLAFWHGKDCKKYVGIDISPHIIELNKKRRPHWQFIASGAQIYHPQVKGNVVFCFDILWPPI